MTTTSAVLQQHGVRRHRGVHFKLRLFAGTTKTYEFTSQFFLDETLTSAIHANSPYSTRGQRNTLNFPLSLLMDGGTADHTLRSG